MKRLSIFFLLTCFFCSMPLDAATIDNHYSFEELSGALARTDSAWVLRHSDPESMMPLLQKGCPILLDFCEHADMRNLSEQGQKGFFTALDNRILELKGVFDVEDRVAIANLHYHQGCILLCRLWINTRLTQTATEDILLLEEKHIGQKKWMHDLFRCIDHWSEIDKPRATQLAETFLAIVRKWCGADSFESFLATHILASTVLTNKEQRGPYLERYLQLAPQWSSDPRYDQFLVENIPYLNYSLQRFFGGDANSSETGVEQHRRWEALCYNKPYIKGEIHSLEGICDSTMLDSIASVASFNANKCRDAKRWTEARDWKTYHIEATVRNCARTMSAPENLWRINGLMIDLRQYSAIVKELKAEDTPHLIVRLMNQMEELNDTVAMKFIQFVVDEWEEQWNKMVNFPQHIEEAIERAKARGKGAYWAALLMKAKAKAIGGKFYQSREDHLRALQLLKDACDLVKAEEGISAHYLDLYSSYIAFILNKFQLDHPTGCQLYEKYMEALKSFPDYNQHIEYLIISELYVNRLAKQDDEWKQQELEQIVRVATPILRDYQPEEHMVYSDSMGYRHFADDRLSTAYFTSSDMDLEWTWSKFRYDRLMDNIIQAYFQLDDSEKTDPKVSLIHIFNGIIEIMESADMGRFYQEGTERLLQQATHLALICQNDSVTQQACNAIMTCKGVKLYAEKLLASMAENTDNVLISELARNRLTLQRNLEGLSAQAPDSVRISLQKQINELGEQLYYEMKKVGHLGLEILQDADDVKAHLSGKEVAIEFAYFSESTQKTRLCAFVLQKDIPHISVIPLCTTEELKELSDPYTSDYIYRQIWEPLLKSFPKNTKRIYFSPIDVLQGIAIEDAMMGKKGKYIGQKFEILRLSTFRELTRTATTIALQNKAVLYGDIDFYSSEPAAQQMQNTFFQDPTRHEGQVWRGQMDALPATKEEVEEIEFLLSERHIQTQKRMGTNGTERSFKALSNSDVTLLHIATHGFIEPSKGSNEQALSHAGLILAGGLSETKDSDGEDGILTALEVSSLNLSNVQMVVLSACQTGLGLINSEGVWGLQRAFKMAGANTLILSLWKVDDDATHCLMTEFYKAWLSGKNKYQALELAKQKVRSHKEFGWDNPVYWASFILLDGLD